MKYFLLVAFSLLAVNVSAFWGTPKLLPAEQRAKEFQFESKLDKKALFQKVIIWSAKTFNNANESVKLKDADAGVLVAKGNLDCKALKLGNGHATGERIDFTVEILVEDKKITVKVEDLIGLAEESYDTGTRPSTPEEMKSVVDQCLTPWTDSIKKLAQ